MSDRELKKRLQDALPERETPAFDAVWRRAEREVRQSRRRYAAFSAVAASAALAAIIGGLWSRQTLEADEYLIADSILNRTQWTAPSDALLPEHRFDIYREIPLQLESTETSEGTFL